LLPELWLASLPVKKLSAVVDRHVRSVAIGAVGDAADRLRLATTSRAGPRVAPLAISSSFQSPPRMTGV
jgi:hypothetical protein